MQHRAPVDVNERIPIVMGLIELSDSCGRF